MAKLLVFAVLLCAVAARIGVHAVPEADCTEDQMMCNDGLSCYDFDLRCDGTRDCADGSDEAYCYDCPKTQKMCDDGLSCYNQSATCDDTWDCADGTDEADCYDFPYTTLDVNGTVTVRAQYTMRYRNDGSVDLLLCSRADCSRVSVFGHYWEGSLAYSSWTGCNRLGRECTGQNSGADGYVYVLPSGEVAVQVQRRPTELAVWRLDHPENNVTVPIEAGGDYNTLMVGTVGVWDSMPVEFIYDGTTAAPTTPTAAPTTPTAAPTTPTAAPTTPTAAPTTPTAAPTTSPTSEPTTV